MAKLVRYLRDSSQEWDLSEEKVITIGRSPASTVTIWDKASSRKHCIIKRENDSYTMVDLGSANGTYVNGNKVSEHVLGNEDKIRIGQTILVFVDE